MTRYFAVPFAQKDKAKALGAWWDKDKECWYARNSDAAVALVCAGFQETLPTPPISLLPGEDRLFGGNGLFVDLVPQSCWFTNVRYCIDLDDWKRLAVGIRKRSGNVCEICGAVPDYAKHMHLEAHERWSYEEDGRQVLKRIISVCRLCHLTTHWGFARMKGQEDAVREHLTRVNGWDDRQANTHVVQAFDLWQERSERPWELDLSIIENASIRIIRPVHGVDRQAISNECLG